MTEVIYRVGDILEIPGNVVLPRQFGMFPKEETCRCLVLNVLHPGFDSISYTFLTHKDGFGTFNIVGVSHANIADCAKLIGHCDISALRYEKPEEGSGDTDLLMLFTAGTIAQVANLRNELDKIKKENEKLRADNEKLRAANASFSQKIKFAEGYFDSAAAALYDGREHLSVALHSIDNK